MAQEVHGSNLLEPFVLIIDLLEIEVVWPNIHEIGIVPTHHDAQRVRVR